MNSESEKKIIDYIKRNRISTTEIADCLGKKGNLPGIYPVTPGMHKVGKTRYIYGFDESNWSIHEQARDIKAGEVVIIDGINVNDRALMGELVTKFILLYKQAEAVVVRGIVRDANDLIRMKYAIWCKGFSPVGCFNVWHEESEEIKEIVKREKEIFDGSICVCDDTGVVIIPKEEIGEEFYKKLEWIEEQEDQWFYCIDRLKWDTYDTVCLKKYLEDK